MANPSDPPKDEFANALRECMPLFWTAAIFSGGVNLLFLASPLYLIQIYNRVIPSGSIATLATLTAFLLFALGTMAVLDSVRSKILIRAGAKLDRLLSERVFQAIVELSLKRGAGVRNAQTLRDLDLFRSAMAGPAAQLFFDFPWSPVFLIALFVINPLLGLVAVGGAIFLLILAKMNDQATRDGAKQANEAGNRSYSFTDCVARYADPVLAMGMQAPLAGRWRIDRDEMMLKQARGADQGANFAAAIRFSRLFLQALILGVGAWLVVRGSILPASIFAASLLLGRALAPLELAVVGWRQLKDALTAGRNVQRALIDAPPSTARTRLPRTGDNHIHLRKVVYVPPGAPQPALKNIDLQIGPGEAVGIVGASGAGKSCLARLLVAAQMPTVGHVGIWGVETLHWDRKALARHIGYLPQNVALFPGTIRENIARFGEATDQQVVEAAMRANVHDLILSLPDAYETMVGDSGAGLSGGERQRIALARALFGRPKLIVLDEPNAHLDAAGEEALRDALQALRKAGATVVLVAHRLNPLAEVDRVLMLNDGRLELDGPKSEVMTQVPTQVVSAFDNEAVEAAR